MEDQPMRYTIREVFDILRNAIEARDHLQDMSDEQIAEVKAKVLARKQARLDKIAAGDAEREITRLSMPRKRKADESKEEYEARVHQLQHLEWDGKTRRENL